MDLVAKRERMFESNAGAKPRLRVDGIAGWLVEAFAQWRKGAGQTRQRKLRVVETLPLGAKRQLLLVSCGGEHFLVGTGPECVQTIVRVQPESDVVAMEKPC